MKDGTTVTILVCGVSGVGKTALLTRVGDQMPQALVWRASELIGEARRTLDPEALRAMSAEEIQHSQDLLVHGICVRRASHPDRLVLLDAHSVIDSDAGLIDVPVEVIARLHPSGIIHVSDDVAGIVKRRQADVTRVRPLRSVSELEAYQRRSLAACKRYEIELGIPLFEITSGDTAGMISAIERIRKG